ESDFEKGNQYYTCYYADELSDISLGFFLHDVGKVMVNEAVLNQTGRLSPKDFEEVKKHSFEYGMMILDKNNLKNAFIKNIIKYHHAPLFINEERCYPLDRSYTQVPVYARICKLADIYDAMTSRRVYKEAINQINVVTRMFRTYAQKDAMLQYVLHAFVKSIGIYPPGSIIYLKNRQMAYVLESDGPVVIPFTDGAGNTLQTKPDPIDISALNNEEPKQVDNSRSISNPKDVFDLLPAYLKRITTAA
ncbi:MAG: HD domain-containing protein, partial [Desulfobacteraceae bacterium]|nr:HD domain-containing protein [Desulfobacteraceae bacterium]